ncbi:MAG: IS110 family transposase [Rhodomicrobium sp.]|nr:IS110 family transposase [Rhodomicrobium sp.]
MKRGIQSVLALFARQVAKLDAEIRQRLENEEEFAELNRVLRSVPGVGPVTAAVLIADMPELGSADRRAIASLAGLAPRAFESGKFKGKRRLGQGRRYVRKALYMAALSVIAQRKLFRASIESMKAAGKPAKTVVVAIARKLLTLLNILVTRNEIFSFEKITANPNPQ